MILFQGAAIGLSTFAALMWLRIFVSDAPGSALALAIGVTVWVIVAWLVCGLAALIKRWAGRS